MRATPSTGGCPFHENPDLDAREARPLWRIGQRPHVQLIPHTDPGAQGFDLWAIPGRKSLCHDGQHLWLHGVSGRELVMLSLSADVEVGRPFAYAMPAGADHRRYRFTLESALTLLQRTGATTPTALSRPPRSALMHMRTLQVLDGIAAGASQRQVAAALFGNEQVSTQWHPDSEVRAQVRYLLERGRSFMQGGYSDLLK